MFQFYIDGASFIDEDPNWQYFVLYLDHRVVGYTSVLEDKSQVGSLGTGKNKVGAFSSRVLLSQFIILPPYQGLGLGSTFLNQVYDYYLNDKQCIEFSVEEPSDEFQSLMDLIEIRLIWQAGYFKTIKKLFKGKRSSQQTITIDNFDLVHLDSEEIMQIQKELKLTKPRIIRCFEMIVLAKLDPKDSQVHARFGQEIKKKLQQQLTKNILAPYFQIENFQPQTNMFINQTSVHNEQIMHSGDRQINCCKGDGQLLCL